MNGEKQSKTISADERITLRDSLPLLVMHVGCVGVLWVGVSRVAVIAAVVLYFLRVFALTGGYHRYFSHNAFKTSRAFQFVLAFVGASAAQRGPLWWASHHRLHHQHPDSEDDIHSPSRHGFWWAHVGWLLCPKYAKADLDRVKDFAKYPELRFLDRHVYFAPATLALALFGLGAWFQRVRPEWGTSGLQLVVWGFFISTVLVYHVTFCINSLMHMIGNRRFETRDTSRNNLALALLSMGEGWHNNHHRYAASVRQGFFWWEVDLTYYVLRMLAVPRIVWDLREPSARVLAEAKTGRAG